jgi:hypothetical protein
MFAGKAGVYPKEAPFRFSRLEQTPDHKHWTRLERLAKDEHLHSQILKNSQISKLWALKVL